MNNTLHSRTKFLPKLLALLLLPLIAAGVSVWALTGLNSTNAPISAAIVNHDKPVELDGKTVPLGRQLTAELVGDQQSEYSWIITTEEDALTGLNTGKYSAIVVIPENFSKAATSFSASDASAIQAKVDLITSSHSKILEDKLAEQVANRAVTVLGGQLTETYIENVLLGFGTMKTRMGEAADGANQLADGTTQLAGRVSELTAGTNSVASGATHASNGMKTFATSVKDYTRGVGQLASGLNQISGNVSGLSGALQQLTQNASQAANSSQALAGGVGQLAQQLGTMAATACAADPSSSSCAELSAQAQAAGNAANLAVTVATESGTANGYAQGIANPNQGLPALISGIQQLAAGAAPLANNSDALANGASQLAAGSNQLATGLNQLATGVSQLETGVIELNNGTTELAGGLGEAVSQIPSYSAAEASKLAKVVSTPITLTDPATNAAGNQTLPTFAALALWFSSLAIFVFLPALNSAALNSTRSSLVLMLKNLWLPVTVAAVQAVLVAGVLGWADSYSAETFFSVAGLLLLAAISFTLVHMAVLAILKRLGYIVLVLLGLVSGLTGMLTAIPGALTEFAAALPANLLSSALTGYNSGLSINSSLTGLAIWLGAGFVILLVSQSMNRTAKAGGLLAAT